MLTVTRASPAPCGRPAAAHWAMGWGTPRRRSDLVNRCVALVVVLGSEAVWCGLPRLRHPTLYTSPPTPPGGTALCFQHIASRERFERCCHTCVDSRPSRGGVRLPIVCWVCFCALAHCHSCIGRQHVRASTLLARDDARGVCRRTAAACAVAGDAPHMCRCRSTRRCGVCWTYCSGTAVAPPAIKACTRAQPPRTTSPRQLRRAFDQRQSSTRVILCQLMASVFPQYTHASVVATAT
jgi:hypothetical protein